MVENSIISNNNKKMKNQRSFKRWFGFGMMIFAIIACILCVFPSFLNIGYFFYRLFGANVWILLILCLLCGFGMFRGLNFVASKKYVLYITLSYLSVLCLIHLIFSTNVLGSYYLDFSHMKAYLDSAYYLHHGVTVGGVVLSIFIYVIRAMLGVVGSYVVYVIMSAIFIGLSIDYIIYNRTIDRRKKLYSEKTKKDLEVKLMNNAKIVDNGENLPQYSFVPSGYAETNTISQTPDTKFDQSSIDSGFDGFGFEGLNKEPVDQNVNSLGDLEQEREIARKKLFENYNFDTLDNSGVQSESQEPQTAREKLFGSEPKLPDYLYTNKNAESDARDFVNNFGTFGSNFSAPNNFSNFEDPTPTKTPNLDDNILGTSAIRSSWGSFDPSVQNESEDNAMSNGTEQQSNEFSAFGNTFGQNSSTASLFGFGSANNTAEQNANDVTFTSNVNNGFENRTFEPQGLKAIIPEQKSEIEKPQKRVTKQTNIYDDAPKKYFTPPLSLLKTYKDDTRDHSAENQRKSAILNQVFDSFKIPAHVSNVVRGPKFTRYEITLQIGVSVTKILQIEKNIEMALETDSGIRIEAPIPGKNAVGIEVKNDVSTTIGLKELLESPEYANSKHVLPVAIGKNIIGDIKVSPLEKMLHLLVAGSTGSGKSVFIHSLIMSLLYKCSPEELKLLIIDPKQVDFVQYNGIPHLVAPEVFFNYEQSVNALTWSVKEMERRYGFLKEKGYSNIKDYNNSPKVKSGEERVIPYIVIIIDEFSNLMSEDKNSTLELMIKKVTEKARAAGIHMVVATQRPSVDVITGVIKNNLPTRVALKLSSGVDSKTILDKVGAEKLLGWGDMLFAPPDTNKEMRLQGAYVSDDEIKSIIKYIKQNNISSYDASIAEEINRKREEPTEEEIKSSSSKESKGDQMDDLMQKCLELVIARGKATTTMLQTKLSIGYSRAARIIGQMEERGFISDNSDGKPREVYITQEQFDQMFGNNN